MFKAFAHLLFIADGKFRGIACRYVRDLLAFNSFDVIKVVIDLIFKMKDGNELRDALKEGCFEDLCRSSAGRLCRRSEQSEKILPQYHFTAQLIPHNRTVRENHSNITKIHHNNLRLSLPPAYCSTMKLQRNSPPIRICEHSFIVLFIFFEAFA